MTDRQTDKDNSTCSCVYVLIRVQYVIKIFVFIQKKKVDRLVDDNWMDLCYLHKHAVLHTTKKHSCLQPLFKIPRQ